MGKFNCRTVQLRRRQQGEYAARRVAIRNHCLECCGWSAAEVRRCTALECWLWPLRLGGGLDTSDAEAYAERDAAEKRYSELQVDDHS